MIGARVQESFDDSKFTEIKFKKKDVLVPLVFLTKSITSTDEKNPVCINPILPLTQLAGIVKKGENVEQYSNLNLLIAESLCLRVNS